MTVPVTEVYNQLGPGSPVTVHLVNHQVSLIANVSVHSFVFVSAETLFLPKNKCAPNSTYEYNFIGGWMGLLMEKWVNQSTS